MSMTLVYLVVIKRCPFYDPFFFKKKNKKKREDIKKYTNLFIYLFI